MLVPGPVWQWPRLVSRCPAFALPWASAVTAVAWAVALQGLGGWSTRSEPLEHPAEFLAAVDQGQHPQAFLQHFVVQLDQYPTHVQSHPPGQVLLLWGLDRIGLGGSGPATVQTLLFAALATAGVLTVTKWEGGETAFRRAAVFVGLTPAAWTVATSTDPTFSGLAVLSVVAAFAAERASTRAALPLAAAAGAALCCADFPGATQSLDHPARRSLRHRSRPAGP